MEEKKYSIDDIVNLTGISRRTIRYYVQERLIDPPAGRGRGGFYYDSHLNALQQIKDLQEKGLSIAAIRAYEKGAPAPPAAQVRSVWLHHEIVPGLEVNVASDLEEKERRKITEIVRFARSLMKEEKNE
jgi:DNA-binding transcriptional MerR regulator